MSETAAAAASDEIKTVTDRAGRKLTLRALNPGDMLDLLEAAGPASVNQGFMQYATAVCSVVEIDGVPVPMARNRDQMKALATRLGNHGVRAAVACLFPSPSPDADDAPAADGTDIAKN